MILDQETGYGSAKIKRTLATRVDNSIAQCFYDQCEELGRSSSSQLKMLVLNFFDDLGVKPDLEDDYSTLDDRRKNSQQVKVDNRRYEKRRGRGKGKNPSYKG